MSFTFTFVKTRKGELNDNLLSITFFAVRSLDKTCMWLDSFVAGGVEFEPTTTDLGGTIDWNSYRDFLIGKYEKQYSIALITILNDSLNAI